MVEKQPGCETAGTDTTGGSVQPKGLSATRQLGLERKKNETVAAVVQNAEVYFFFFTRL